MIENIYQTTILSNPKDQSQFKNALEGTILSLNANNEAICHIKGLGKVNISNAEGLVEGQKLLFEVKKGVDEIKLLSAAREMNYDQLELSEKIEILKAKSSDIESVISKHDTHHFKNVDDHAKYLLNKYISSSALKSKPDCDKGDNEKILTAEHMLTNYSDLLKVLANSIAVEQIWYKIRFPFLDRANQDTATDIYLNIKRKTLANYISFRLKLDSLGYCGTMITGIAKTSIEGVVEAINISVQSQSKQIIADELKTVFLNLKNNNPIIKSVSFSNSNKGFDFIGEIAVDFIY